MSQNISTKRGNLFGPNPPFPAFPSGHAIQAATTATILTELYGEKIFHLRMILIKDAKEMN